MAPPLDPGRRLVRALMPQAAVPQIVITGLRKVYAPLQLRLRSWRPVRRQAPVLALDDLDLVVGPGEVLALLGTNGAGKTSLIKILATVVLPTTGSVRVGGHDVITDPNAVQALVGHANSEERSFYYRLTGRQNLEFFAAFQGLTGGSAARRIADLRDEVGLDALDRPYGEYSTGMRHRLSIARALLRHPQVLLLDEPTRSLDPLAAEAVRALVRDRLVKARGCTVVLATHNLDEARALSDRMAVLHRGRLAACGTATELEAQSGARGGLTDAFARLTAQVDRRLEATGDRP